MTRRLNTSKALEQLSDAGSQFPASAALIALDWGSSSFRASLLDDEGAVLESRASPRGVLTISSGAYASVLRDLCSDWLTRDDIPVIASGMIGSKQGWKEAAYLECPSTASDAARALTRVEFAARHIYIVPGLTTKDSNGYADVMRGEETQLWGVNPSRTTCCVLPGTHSKWAWTAPSGAITAFETYPTGELYAVLANHSSIGRAMTFGLDDLGQFAKGVRRGLSESHLMSHAVFTARAMCVKGEMRSSSLPDYVSGLLIGSEIAGILSNHEVTNITLIGNESLTERYLTALEIAGLAASMAPPFAAERGLFLIARAAGLMGQS